MAQAPKNQFLLNDLLSRTATGKLSKVETLQLDQLLNKIDELNLVKAHAAVVLQRIADEKPK